MSGGIVSGKSRLCTVCHIITASFHDILVNKKNCSCSLVCMVFKLFHTKARISGANNKVVAAHGVKVVMSCHAMTVSISHGYHD